MEERSPPRARLPRKHASSIARRRLLRSALSNRFLTRNCGRRLNFFAKCSAVQPWKRACENLWRARIRCRICRNAKFDFQERRKMRKSPARASALQTVLQVSEEPSRKHLFVTVAFAALAMILPTGANAQQHRFQVSDTEKLVSVADPQISPDDKSIAVMVARQNMKEDGTDSEIVLIDIATGEQRVLTSGHKHASSPRWSPDGKTLAFIAAAGEEKDAKPQVFVLPMEGGDSRKITDAPDGVEQFAWRPDGKMIAYVTPDPTDKKAIAAHHDSFQVGDTDYLETAAAQPSHVWVVSSDGSGAKRITSGSWSLPIVFPPSPPASPLSWSPDGNSLLITHQETPEPGDGRSEERRVGKECRSRWWPYH